jgi:predicted flavoprotein YhiN
MFLRLKTLLVIILMINQRSYSVVRQAHFKIGVIGGSIYFFTFSVKHFKGGPAGYFAAVECAARLEELAKQSKLHFTNDITIFEAGRTPLSKVLISGGGRCNVMHDPNKGILEISKGYPRGSKELLSPFSSKFGPYDTFDWFSARGVDLKIESDGRVFPTTDRSETIVNVLENESKKHHIRILTRSRVENVSRLVHNGSYQILYSPSKARETSEPHPGVGRKEVEADDKEPKKESDLLTYSCDRVIFATGSNRPALGLLESLGHTVASPLPSLFSFKLSDADLTALVGLPVSQVEARIVLDKTKRAQVCFSCSLHHISREIDDSHSLLFHCFSVSL